VKLVKLTLAAVTVKQWTFTVSISKKLYRGMYSILRSFVHRCIICDK